MLLVNALRLTVVAAVVASPLAAQVQQGAAAPGTLQLGSIAAPAREAVFASIDARQNMQFMLAHREADRALRADSTFGLARVLRVDQSGAQTNALANEEYRRAIADVAGRTAGEQAYVMGLRSTGVASVRFLETALGLMPNDRRVALDLALANIGTVRLDSLRAVSRRHPDFLAPRLWLAYYLSVAPYTATPAQLYESLVVAEDAVRLAPRHASTHTILGHALQRMGRPDEAVGHLQAATRMDPQNEYAFFLLAEIYARDGKPGSVDRARAALDSALAVNPNTVRRLNQRRDRAILLFYDGRKAQGYAELDGIAKEFAAAGVPSTAAVVYSQMAGLAAGTGDTADVEKYVSEARRVSVPATDITIQLTQAYALARKPVEARKELSEYVRRAPDTTTAAFRANRHRLEGMVLLAEGKATEALAALRRTDPAQNSFTRLAIIDAHAMLKDKAAAAAAQAAYMQEPTSNAAISTAIVHYRARKK